MLSNFLISPRCLLDFQIFSNLINYKDPPIYLKLESRVYTESYNPVRNILKKIEKKAKLDKTVQLWYLFLCIFWVTVPKFISAGETEY